MTIRFCFMHVSRVYCFHSIDPSCWCTVDISSDTGAKMTHTVEAIKKLMGEPRNYGRYTYS